MMQTDNTTASATGEAQVAEAKARLCRGGPGFGERQGQAGGGGGGARAG